MTTATVGSEKEMRERRAMRERQAMIERAWASLPSSYAIPEVAPTLDEARAWCRRLAGSHYENFHVASWFLPKDLRPHFHAIYAYCRVSDDLGDEVGDTEQSLALLDIWSSELDACYEGRARHPVFVALAETIKECFIPKEPFADLLVAFRQDQTVTRYETIEDLLAYCRYSANPVGRLVLYACGESNEENFRLSDATCSALQLANFWQDVRADYKRGRIYIPKKDMDFYGITEQYIAEGICTPSFRGLMQCEIDYTRTLFEQGLPLIGKVNRDLAIDLELFSRGGLEILRAIERQECDVLSARPAISKGKKMALLLRAVSGKLLPFQHLGSQAREES
jgi:squalene synthase HpnC